MPGHASFPSGHATEAFLIALAILEAVMPAAASATVPLNDRARAGQSATT